MLLREQGKAGGSSGLEQGALLERLDAAFEGSQQGCQYSAFLSRRCLSCYFIRGPYCMHVDSARGSQHLQCGCISKLIGQSVQHGSILAGRLAHCCLRKARSVVVSSHCSMDTSAAPGFAWQRSLLALVCKESSDTAAPAKGVRALRFPMAVNDSSLFHGRRS